MSLYDKYQQDVKKKEKTSLYETYQASRVKANAPAPIPEPKKTFTQKVSDVVTGIKNKVSQTFNRPKTESIPVAPTENKIDETPVEQIKSQNLMDKFWSKTINLQKQETPQGTQFTADLPIKTPIGTAKLKVGVTKKKDAKMPEAKELFLPTSSTREGEVFRQYIGDTAKTAVSAVSGAGKLTPAYMAYRAVKGDPMTPKEYLDTVLSTTFDSLATLWRVSPEAPAFGATLETLKALRQKKEGKLTWDEVLNSPLEGVVKQPAFGEVFTDNVNTAKAIDTIFLIGMFGRGFAKKKLSSANIKASEISEVSKTLGVKPNATLDEISNAFKAKIKEYPDTFTLSSDPARMKIRTELTNAFNILKKTKWIDKQYATAYEFVTSKLGGITKKTGKVTPEESKLLGSGEDIKRAVDENVPTEVKFTPEKLIEQVEVTDLKGTALGDEIIKVADDAQKAGKAIEIYPVESISKTGFQNLSPTGQPISYKLIDSSSPLVEGLPTETPSGIPISYTNTPDVIRPKTAKIEPIKTEVTKVEPIKPKVEPIKVLENINEKQIETVKTIKDVRTSIKTVKTEIANLTAEAEGKAVVAQEKRSDLNTENIAKLKRTYSINKKFQEGDIETIRNSKSGQLLNSVLENIQEKYPNFSEQEAFDFALDLPNKSAEKVRKSSELRVLLDKQKKLDEYLKLLKTKQDDLAIKQDDVLFQEWNEVLSAQENLAKVIEVTRSQLPIGRGKTKVSRLEARVKGVLKNATQDQIDELGLSTYNQMNKKDTIAKASEYVTRNPEEALKVLRGVIEPPEGLNSNSIFVALSKADPTNAEMNAKLATLKSTAMGQNISILTEMDPDSPIKHMNEVIKVREAVAERKLKGKTPAKAEADIRKALDKKIAKAKPSKYSWSKFLDEIQC